MARRSPATAGRKRLGVGGSVVFPLQRRKGAWRPRRFTRFNLLTLQSGDANFPRNLALDFLQYICERPDMTPQHNLHHEKEIHFAISLL